MFVRSKGVRSCVRLRLVAPILFISALLSNLSAQQILTIDEAISLALQNNGDALAALSSVQGAEARLQAARSRLYPSVEPNYSYTNSRVSGSGQTLNTDQRQGGISAQWLLLDSGQRDLSVRQSSRSLEFTRFSTRNTLRQIIFQTTRAYYDVLRRMELLKVAESSVERAKTLLDAAKAQADPAVGVAPQKDVLQAEADLANAEVQLITAQNNYETAQTELKRIIGWQMNTPLPRLTETPDPPVPVQLPDLKMLQEQALLQRPDIQTSELNVQIERLGVRSAQLDTLPSFQVSANASHNFEPRNQDQTQLRFTASYPLFDGGLTRSNLKSAQATLQSAEYRYEQAKRDALADVEIAYLNYVEAGKRLTASKKAVEAARTNYNAASESQKEGVGTIIEVITAQTALITAETNAVQAIYDYFIADLQLKIATGTPLPQEK